MTPSLLSLFKRGQYRRSRFVLASIEDSGDPKERQERERFLTAAIGFVACHDPKCFGQHLLSVFDKAVAKVGKGVSACDVKLEYRLKRKWLDLVIEEPQVGGSVVHVIEVKFGANLSAHQDPSKLEFWDPDNGYGTLICQEFPNAKAIRYWVLGHKQEIQEITPAGSQRLHPDWKASQLKWSDLAHGFPRSPLAHDLYRLLETMGIPAFMMKQTESDRVSGDVDVAARAYRVLEDTCTIFGLQRRSRTMDVHSDLTEKKWHFGIELRAVRDKGGNQKRLTKAVGPKVRCPAAWLGYERNGKKSDLAVWFYCGKAANKADIEEKLLRSMKAQLTLNDFSDEPYVWVTKLKSCETADRKWLTSVFKAVGMMENV